MNPSNTPTLIYAIFPCVSTQIQIRSSTKIQMAWRDITESFKEACSKLPEETLVSNPHFNLFDCISAIPVSDKKMVNFEGFGCWSWRESERESERESLESMHKSMAACLAIYRSNGFTGLLTMHSPLYNRILAWKSHPQKNEGNGLFKISRILHFLSIFNNS